MKIKIEEENRQVRVLQKIVPPIDFIVESYLRLNSVLLEYY